MVEYVLPHAGTPGMHIRMYRQRVGVCSIKAAIPNLGHYFLKSSNVIIL